MFSFKKSDEPLSSYFLLLTIPIYFLLDGINNFRGLLTFSTGFKILSISVLASFATAFILNLKLDRHRSILITTWLLICYLFFRVILDSLTYFKFLQILNTAYYYLPFFIILTLVLLIWLHKMSVEGRQKLVLYLNFLFLVLVSAELINFFSVKLNTKLYSLTTNKIVTESAAINSKPNIYLFVLDEYAGLKSTKEQFGYDNSPFKDSLEKRSFFFVKNSMNNYNMTLASMLATFEMGYITNYNKKEFAKSTIHAVAAEAIKDNNVVEFFHSNGYTFINNSFYSINHSTTKPFAMLPVEDRLLMDKTFGRVITNGVLQNIPNNRLQSMLNTQFSKTFKYNERVIALTNETIQKKESPFFLYSHFVIPHLPYLKDKNGKTRKFSDAYLELKNKTTARSYVEYMQYANKLMLDFADSVIKKDKNAILIIMSDHGYRWGNKKTNRSHHFDNFLAVFKTDSNYKGFTETTCLVNLFRIILNNNFGQNLSLLNCHSIDIADGHIKE